MNVFVAVLVLILVNIIWGSTFGIVKDSLASMEVFSFLFWRFLLGAIILTVSVFFKKKINLNKKIITGGIYAGLALFFGYFLQTEGLKYTGITRSGFITGLYVITVPFFTYILMRVKPALRSVIGLAVSCGGMYLFSVSQGFDFYLNKGDILTIFAALCFGIQITFLGMYVRKENLLEFTAIELLVVTFLSGTTGMIYGENFAVNNDFLYFSIFLTGILATGLCFLLQSLSQNYIPPNKAAVIYTTEPLAAGVFAYLFYGEILSVIQFVGAFLILTGVLVTELKLK